MENRPLTSLRFLAALYVFCYHMSRWPISDAWAAKAILLRGALGMSVFFILSGFVMALRYHSAPPLPRQYYWARFSRIYPVYLLAAALTVPWLISTVLTYHKGPPTSYLIFNVISNALLLQAWFPETFNIWNAGGSWSISTEAFFYALFPLIFPAIAKIKDRQLFFLAGVAWLMSALVSLVYHAGALTSAFPVYYAIPAFRFPEFLCGIAVGMIFVRRAPITYSSFKLLASTCVLIAYILWIGRTAPDQPNIGDHWITVPILAGLIFSAASLKSGPLYRLMSSRVLTYLGRISYSFYSMQLLLLLSLASGHERLVSKWPWLASNWKLWICAFAALICASAACHHFVEEPARRRLSARKRATDLVADEPSVQRSGEGQQPQVLEAS